MEGYYQFGEIGDGYATGRNMDIEAYAFHIDGGLTLPVPMAPRLSAEFNTASGEVRMMANLAALINCTPPTTFTSGTWTACPGRT